MELVEFCVPRHISEMSISMQSNTLILATENYKKNNICIWNTEKNKQKPAVVKANIKLQNPGLVAFYDSRSTTSRPLSGTVVLCVVWHGDVVVV